MSSKKFVNIVISYFQLVTMLVKILTFLVAVSAKTDVLWNVRYKEVRSDIGLNLLLNSENGFRNSDLWLTTTDFGMFYKNKWITSDQFGIYTQTYMKATNETWKDGSEHTFYENKWEVNYLDIYADLDDNLVKVNLYLNWYEDDDFFLFITEFPNELFSDFVLVFIDRLILKIC